MINFCSSQVNVKSIQCLQDTKNVTKLLILKMTLKHIVS